MLVDRFTEVAQKIFAGAVRIAHILRDVELKALIAPFLVGLL